ncbi:alpha/beta hydrolase [Desulfofundulus thermobenzoicus]|nr:alpha/beta fold hydrolase [Desulfofundulus thermobenzoicus]
MEKPVTIPYQGKKMFGMMHLPEGQDTFSMVVTMHGFVGVKSAPHRMLVKLARKLVDSGYGVLRFDFIGAGDSEGDYRDMTISGEINEAMAAVDWLRNDSGLRIKKLGILGYSMGGCVAACCSNRIQDVSTVVLWSPISNPFWNFAYLIGDDFVNGLAGNDVVVEGNIIGPGFFAELVDINPVAEIAHYDQPVLLIHAARDEQVLPLNALAYKHVFKNNASHVCFIDDATHLFDKPHQEEELISRTVEWFQKYL